MTEKEEELRFATGGNDVGDRHPLDLIAVLSKALLDELYVHLKGEMERGAQAEVALARHVSSVLQTQFDLEQADLIRIMSEAVCGERLRMFESYEGVVKYADDDQVIVVYEVDGELVEQNYVPKQFMAGKLPKVGDALAVFVHIAQLPDRQDETEGKRTSDERRSRPKNSVPLPRTF